MQALIDDGLVIQAENNSFPVAAPLEWRDCPDGVEAGWRYKGGEWIAPPVEPQPSIDDLRGNAVAMIKAAAFERIEAVMPTWMAVRAMNGGPAVAADIQAKAERLRTVSDALEAQVAGMDGEALAGFDPAADEHWAG